MSLSTSESASVTARIVSEVLAGLTAGARPYARLSDKPLSEHTINVFQKGFAEYLRASYDRCRTFKTILNPQDSIDVLSHYVNVTLSCGDETLDDVDLVERLSILRHVVITGLAGSGKSMFMKYLTTMHFKHPRGVIPLFVELRHLNPLTDRDLLTFVRTSCASKTHNVTESQFESGLLSGAFLLILDGFDEVHREHMDEIEAQVLEIQERFPNCPIIVSSRPDKRFEGWGSFREFRVNELTQGQTIALIESLEYTPGVKKRFLREVRARLFTTHGSFLKYPLLTTIMMLTFEEFAEIPRKMHSFYSQAFDTLFQKHDAQKDQFKRHTETGLTRDEFRRTFSAFCAMSYLDQRFSFTEEQLSQTAKYAVDYAKQTIKGYPAKVAGEHLSEDLYRVVCMLQPDGTEWSFVHRSFQEYFAALFATQLHGERVGKFIEKCTSRYYDNVIAMANDMAPELIEKEWVIPTIDAIQSAILGDGSEDVGSKISKIADVVSLSSMRHHLLDGLGASRTGLMQKIDALALLYPDKLSRDHVIEPLLSLDVISLSDKILLPQNQGMYRFGQFERLLSASAKSEPHQLDIELNSKDTWWLTAIGVDRKFDALRRGLASLRREITGRDRKRGNILEEFL